MKKALLIVFIIILMGGCVLGGWYYLTHQSADKGVNVKLQGTSQIIVKWDSAITTEEQKNNYRWGKTSDEAFIQAVSAELTLNKVANYKVELNEDYTGKLYSDNTTEFVGIYYAFNHNRQEVRTFMNEDYSDYSPYFDFTIIDGEFWHVAWVNYYQDENIDGCPYRILIKFDQVK